MAANYDGGVAPSDASLAAGDSARGPCAGCPHLERCRQGLACTAMQLFVDTGRFSALAPRQPRRDIFERLYPS
jgi:hypothetical protein